MLLYLLSNQAPQCTSGETKVKSSTEVCRLVGTNLQLEFPHVQIKWAHVQIFVAKLMYAHAQSLQQAVCACPVLATGSMRMPSPCNRQYAHAQSLQQAVCACPVLATGSMRMPSPCNRQYVHAQSLQHAVCVSLQQAVCACPVLATGSMCPCNRQYAPCNRQCAPCNRQYAPCNRQYAPCNRQYAPCNRVYDIIVYESLMFDSSPQLLPLSSSVPVALSGDPDAAADVAVRAKRQLARAWTITEFTPVSQQLQLNSVYCKLQASKAGQSNPILQ